VLTTSTVSSSAADAATTSTSSSSCCPCWGAAAAAAAAAAATSLHQPAMCRPSLLSSATTPCGKKNAFSLHCFPWLSRACLGNLIVFDENHIRWLQKTAAFAPRRPSLSCRRSPRRATTPQHRLRRPLLSLLFEFSLCLSQACLGKMMHFIYKWRKNAVFSPAVGSCRGRPCSTDARKRNHSFLSAVSLCLSRACLGKMMPFYI